MTHHSEETPPVEPQRSARLRQLLQCAAFDLKLSYDIVQAEGAPAEVRRRILRARSDVKAALDDLEGSTKSRP